MLISFVLPTRDRPGDLRRTLDEIGSLPAGVLGDGAEVIVVDNASSEPITFAGTLGNGVRAECITLDTNAGAAARNVGVARALGEWIVMLDDDSHPLACDIAAVDGILTQEELRLLEIIRHTLELDRLVSAAIERGARARWMIL